MASQSFPGTVIFDELIAGGQGRARPKDEGWGWIAADQCRDCMAIDVVLDHRPDHVRPFESRSKCTSGPHVQECSRTFFMGQRSDSGHHRTRRGHLAYSRDQDRKVRLEELCFQVDRNDQERASWLDRPEEFHGGKTSQAVPISLGSRIVTNVPSDPIAQAVLHNQEYADRRGVKRLPTEPAKHLAIVTCMDSRLDLFGALGLDLGEAHIIRNAGGIATDDVVRSLVLSQRLLGTDRIMVIHHTFCGLENLDEDALRTSIERETGVETMMAFGSFTSAADNVQQTMARLNQEPALKHVDIQGFVFDVDSGALLPVEPD